METNDANELNILDVLKRTRLLTLVAHGTSVDDTVLYVLERAQAKVTCLTGELDFASLILLL